MKSHTPELKEESFVQTKETKGFTNHELHQLVHEHQRFFKTVKMYNEQAELQISSNSFKEAQRFLGQAEKILQYGASCGKNIDRSLIISILHNEACTYQKLWELTKCSNYLQALIFNMKEYLDLEQVMMDKKDKEPVPICTKFFLHKGLRLIKYYLQYAAINSQMKNHDDAFGSSKNAVKLLKIIFKSLNASFMQDKETEPSSPFETKEQCDLKYKIVSSISMMDEVHSLPLSNYISTCAYFYFIWKNSKGSFSSEVIQDALKKFSIGNVMQIVCDSMEESSEPQTQNIYFHTNDTLYNQVKRFEVMRAESYLKILEKILLISIAYFTTATELRLYSNQKYKQCSQLLKNNPHFRQSQIYHLVSLMVIFAYVPFQMQFVTHIITSYQKHYQGQIDIFNEENYPQKQIEQIAKKIDPLNIHLIYFNKKQETDSKNQKTLQIISKKQSKTQSLIPKKVEVLKPRKNTISKLQKHCKQIINKRYTDSERQQKINKEEAMNSLTYVDRKKYKNFKNRKKSYSIANSISNAFIKKEEINTKIHDYYSPKKQRKHKDFQIKETVKKIDEYHNEVISKNAEKSMKKLDWVKTSKPKVYVKKSKSKAQKKKENTKKQEKGAKVKSKTKTFERNRSESLITSNILKTNEISPAKTPKKVKKELRASTEYYY